MYVGEVLYMKDDEGKVTDRVANGTGTVYYDMPGLRIKYTGEFELGLYDGVGVFYSPDNNITITSNNISAGIPTQEGKLHINYSKKKEVIRILFNDIWDKAKATNKNTVKQIVLLDNFVSYVAKLNWSGDIPLENLVFYDKSLDEKYFDLWTIIVENINSNKINAKQAELNHKNVQAMVFNMTLLIFILIIVNIIGIIALK